MTSVVTFKKRKNKKKQKQNAKVRVSSVFGTCSDSASGQLNAGGGAVDAYQQSIQRMLAKQQNGRGSKLQEDTRKELDSAIAAYSSLGNEKEKIKNTRDNLDKAKHESKYIDKLLSTSKSREVRNSIAKERMIQKRQDAESAIYGTTEEFFSEAYKHKVAEQQKQEKILYNKGFLKSITTTKQDTSLNTRKVDAAISKAPTTSKVVHDENGSNGFLLLDVEMSIAAKLELAKRKYKERQSIRMRNNIIF